MSTESRVACPSGRGFLPYYQGTALAAGTLTIQGILQTQGGATPTNATAGVFTWTNTFPFTVLVRGARLVIITPSAAGGTVTAGKAPNGGSLPSVAYASTLAVATAGIRNIAGLASATTAGADLLIAPGEAFTISRDGGDVTDIRGHVVLTLVPTGGVLP